MIEKINAWLGRLSLADYGNAIVTTVLITLISTFFAYVLGLVIGVVLYGTDKDGIFPNKPVNTVLGFIVNVLRSVPFIILLILCQPVAKLLVGTKIGNTAFVVYLTVAAAPFVGRMIESSLKEVDRGVIEAAQSMGTSNFRIIMKVLLPEALPSLLNGCAIALTTILGYTPMTYLIGGGGLGNYAITYGIYRFDSKTMYLTSLLLIILVQVVQEIFIRTSRGSDHRIRR